MAKFVRCSCENTELRNDNIENNPVNINLVWSIRKFIHYYYQDEGTHAIKFRCIGKEDIIWVYNPKQQKKRDEDFERIVNNNN